MPVMNTSSSDYSHVGLIYPVIDPAVYVIDVFQIVLAAVFQSRNILIDSNCVLESTSFAV